MSYKLPILRVIAALFSLLLLTNCAAQVPRGGGDILVIGDSIMAWNRTSNTAISDVIAAELSRDVIARAVPGAQFDNGSVLASAVGFDIRAQYREGPWNWVILNGGANDMGFGECGCGDCSALVDKLISEDGTTGMIPTFLDRVQRNSAKVLWLGYYKSPGKSFSGCADDLDVLEGRIARAMVRRPGGYFVDGGDYIAKGDPSHFYKDDTHPSRKGSAILGTALADLIRRTDGRSQNP